MKDSLSISVVVITLNRAEWLKDTLGSLVRQTRQPDEVIVVDNDSQDNTKGVKYVSEKTRGIPYARNTGVRNATGDIVAFIDDDCIADENWLKYIQIPFFKDPNVGSVGGETSYLENGKSMVEEFYKRYMR